MNGIKEFVNEEKIEIILRNLIKINSTQPDGNESDVIKYILSIFKDYDINFKEINHGNNRSSLIITVPGENKEESISFIGHVDTVPVEDGDKWIHPPFEGVIENGYIYGRGSADMKGGDTSMILTLLYILENNIVPKYNIKFCFTADEEKCGIGVLAMKSSKELDDSKCIIIAEPTDEKLGIAEKGAFWLGVDVEGLSAHGSRPDLGVNAIEYLFNFIEKFRSKIENEDEHDLLGKTTLSLNEFEGGVGTNVVPTRAIANLDIRTIPGVDHKEILKIAQNIADDFVKNVENLKISLEIKNDRPALEIEKTDKLVEDIKEIFEKLDYETDYKGMFFYTDGSQIIPDMDIPFIILGPGHDEMAHQRNEKVKLSSISKISEIYINYVLDL